MAKHRYTNEEIEQWRRDHDRTLYFNPDDTRIMVPKASGLGLIPNFAHPMGWLALILIIVAIGTVSMLLTHVI